MCLKRNTFLLVLLLCSLSLWFKSTDAGSSFLSPSQKPQSRVKSPRGGRQVMEDADDITLAVPFEIGVTMKDEDFEEFIVAFQGILQRLLGNTETEESPSQL
ncbi:appetite-regulating hormone [Antennarius striatus]|uniref:appetite-regulating hormone n=1 Tax=Antennarius striatus TaxID=241820 RepID=UPI0035AD9C67